LEEEAHVESGGHGVGEGEKFPGARAATHAVGAVGGPMQEGKTVGGVDQGDQVADLTLGEGRDGGAGVVGEHRDLERGGMEPGVVEQDRNAGECGEGVVGAAGVSDHVEALVAVEAKEEGDDGVAEDVQVGEVEGEGSAECVGSREAEGQAADGRRDVVAESVAGGGGLEGRGCDLGVTAEPRVPDDIAGCADVGEGGGDVGLGS